MGRLDELKRSGGFCLPDARGAWVTYGPGELARCPAPRCGRGFMQASHVSRISVRVALHDIPSDTPSGFVICQDGRCKTRLEIRITECQPKT